MSKISQLVGILKERNILLKDITPIQAENMAIRIAGGVDAYVDELLRYDTEDAIIKKGSDPTIKFDGKFSQVMGVS